MAVPPVSPGTPNTHFEPAIGTKSPSIPSSLVSMQAGKEGGSCFSTLFSPFTKFFNWILSLFCKSEKPEEAGGSAKPKIEGLPEEIDIQGDILLTNGHIFKALVAYSVQTGRASIYFPQDDKDLLATRETLVGVMDREQTLEALAANKICFFPMREGPHWKCIIINPSDQVISFYDSKGTGTDTPDFLQQINTHLEIDYRIDLPTPKSIQPDGFQCGIWILYFLDCERRDIDFDGEVDIAGCRDAIQKMLIDANSAREANLAALQEQYGTEFATAQSLDLSGVRPDQAMEFLTLSLTPLEVERGLLRSDLNLRAAAETTSTQ